MQMVKVFIQELRGVFSRLGVNLLVSPLELKFKFPVQIQESWQLSLLSFKNVCISGFVYYTKLLNRGERGRLYPLSPSGLLLLLDKSS